MISPSLPLTILIHGRFLTSFSVEQAVFAPKAFIGLRMAESDVISSELDFERKRKKQLFPS